LIDAHHDVPAHRALLDTTPKCLFKEVMKAQISGLRRRGCASPARGFEQKPGSAFGFVDPILDQARGRDILIFVAKRVGFAKVFGELLVIVA
jgi:hypothetical protein